MGRTKIVFLFCLLVTTSASAAIPVHQAGTEKQDRYIDLGVYVGGRDHGPLKLLNVRHSITSQYERLVFDVGENAKVKGLERPGFFHIALQDKPLRIVVDLENVSQSTVNAMQISRLFAKSPHFSKVSLASDSIHSNLTLEFPLKVRSRIEVFELVTPGKPGRIVMDVSSL